MTFNGLVGALTAAALGLLCASIAPSTIARADTKPVTLNDWDARPDWLRLSGRARVRYEALDGQYIAGRTGSDQAVFTRVTLLAEADLDPVTFGIELADMRGYFDDDGTALSASFVNPLDVLQAYARVSLDGLFGAGVESRLTLGRMTLHLGSTRLVTRNGYRNAIQAFTGAYSLTRWGAERELHAFYTTPVGRLPSDRDAVGRNEGDLDEEQWGRRFWAVHYRHGQVRPGTYLDLFVYGLTERDRHDLETQNRRYAEPGIRLYHPPRVGAWDYEGEAAIRLGTARASRDPLDREDLDLRAGFVHAELGYTFDHPWRPRLGIDYDYASGDGDPEDGTYGRRDALFGARRTDLGNTSLHGPLRRSNLSAPGARVSIRPSRRFDARLAWKAAFLASQTDAWVSARVRDASGQSGRFIGHAIDGRARYWLVPDALRVEAGASLLLNGRFAEDAPNATGQGDTLYGFAQITSFF